MEEEIIEEEEFTESDNYDENSDDDPDWAKTPLVRRRTNVSI